MAGFKKPWTEAEHSSLLPHPHQLRGRTLILRPLNTKPAVHHFPRFDYVPVLRSLILLDLGRPDRDGLEVIRSVRQVSQTPIIVLSARGQDQDKVEVMPEARSSSTS
jgi:CheY-like chemotaxis protein